MTDEEPDPESPPKDGVVDDREESTETINTGSSALRVLHAIRRQKEHDVRVIEQFSRASLPQLYMYLSQSKNQKYELLRQYSDLERLRDIHPRRGSLHRLERRIWLLEEAISAKEIKTPADEKGIRPSLSNVDMAAVTGAPSEHATAEDATVRKMKKTETVAWRDSLTISEVASETSAAQTARRRAGRKPKAEYNAKVAEVLRDFPDWRDHPHDACEALDKRGVGLPPGSKKAREGGWTTWMDALDKDAEWLRKALQYRAAIR